MIRTWLREPLAHFLLAGLALFALISWRDGAGNEGKRIRIGQDDLIGYLESRAQAYDEREFAAMFAQLPQEDQRALIRDAALQEVLYREGEALQIAKADPLIRQRIVQQMRLLLMEEAAANARVGSDDLAAHYRSHQDDYAVPPQLTFTHVFINNAKEDAPARARVELSQLRADRVAFERAGERGDRFLYQLNYLAASRELVAAHFGKAFADAVFSARPGQWQGPFRSNHGWHLVLVRERSGGQVAPLEMIRDQVLEDALAARRTQLGEGALRAAMAEYKIVVDKRLGQ